AAQRPQADAARLGGDQGTGVVGEASHRELLVRSRSRTWSARRRACSGIGPCSASNSATARRPSSIPAAWIAARESQADSDMPAASAAALAAWNALSSRETDTL